MDTYTRIVAKGEDLYIPFVDCNSGAKMNIALDWDDTFTRDTAFWEEFIQSARDHGHSVTIVTARSPDVPIEYIPKGVEEVIYCSFKAKKPTTDMMGKFMDVWIDDTPLAITQGYV